MRICQIRVALLAASALSSAGLSAQTTPTGDPAVQADVTARKAEQRETAEDDVRDTEILVTARRREESLVSVPVVVSVQTAADISRYNASDLSSIGALTPSVIIGTYGLNGGGTIAIRGISSPANQSGFEQAVSVAIDGVQTSNGHIAQVGFFDLAQSEVMKGPQALFFGKNSPAGVISLTTTNPTDEFLVKGSAYYEFIADEAQIDGIISGPVTENLKARLAVRYNYTDGWLRNRAGPIANPFYRPATGAPASVANYPGTDDPRPGSKALLGRLTLLYDPSDDLTIKLKAFGSRSSDPGPGVFLQNIGPCVGPNPRVNGIPDPYGDCRVDRNVSTGNVPPAIGETFGDFSADGKSKGRLTIASGVLDIDKTFGNISLSSLTGYTYVKYKWFSGLDHSVYSQIAEFERSKDNAFSQEIRLSSDFDGAINFMIGGYYSDSDTDIIYDVKLNDANYVASVNRYSSFAKAGSQDAKSYSAFGQLRWDITDTVELAGGARYTHEKKRQTQRNLYGIGGFNTFSRIYADSTDKTPGVLASTFTDNNVSPEATLTWRPKSNRTLFVAYKTGFKSGGFGLTNPLSVASTVAAIDFESEKARGFEVGAKGLFLGGRLRLSAAAFAYRFSNLQVNVYDPVAVAYNINNAGAVRQRGAEFDVNYRVGPALTLHSAVSYVNNRFEDFTGQCYAYAFPTGATRATATPPPNCSFANNTALTLQQVYDGRSPARSPTWTGNFGFIATLPVASNSLEFTGDAVYSDHYYAAETRVATSRQPSYVLLNASINFLLKDSAWKIGLVGRNLTNNYTLLYAQDRTNGTGVPGAIGEQRGAVNRGRQIAAQASFEF